MMSFYLQIIYLLINIFKLNLRYRPTCRVKRPNFLFLNVFCLIDCELDKDVFFPNINRTQAAEIDLDLQNRSSEGPINLAQIR